VGNRVKLSDIKYACLVSTVGREAHMGEPIDLGAGITKWQRPAGYFGREGGAEVFTKFVVYLKNGSKISIEIGELTPSSGDPVSVTW
jgi:hypothetical protein